MAWNNADEIRVANNGQVYVAPVGTSLPTTPTETLNTAFTGLGYVTQDGASLSVTPEISEVMAWQSRQAVRRNLTSQEVQISFQLQQWNEETVPFAFGGGTITQLGGSAGYRYDLPEEDDALDEKAMVIDAVDGDITFRFVFPRGNVTEAVETNFKRDEAALLPITFKALEPETGGGAGYFLFSDNTAFADGS